MIRTLALMLLLAAPLTAQNDDAAKARIAAGCGADEVRFDVKTDKKQHPTGTAEAGRALVYVFADTASDNAHAAIGGWVTAGGRTFRITPDFQSRRGSIFRVPHPLRFSFLQRMRV